MRDYVREYPIRNVYKEKQSQLNGEVVTYRIKPEEAAAHFEKVGANGYNGEQKKPLKFNRNNLWDGG